MLCMHRSSSGRRPIDGHVFIWLWLIRQDGVPGASRITPTYIITSGRPGGTGQWLHGASQRTSRQCSACVPKAQREWHGYFWGGMAWYNGIKDNVVSCFDSRRHEGRVSVMIMAMTKCLRSLYVVSDDLHVTTEILTSFPDLV